MGVGSWSIRLINDTPQSFLDVVGLDRATAGWGAGALSTGAAFGHIIITPTHVDPSSVDPLTVARYTGILRSTSAKPNFEIGGPGIAAWLADEDKKGDVIRTALTKTAGTFVSWITDLKPDSLAAGTYHAVASTLTHTFLFIDRRTALDYVCEVFGTEWKITPDLKLHGGLASDLFVTTPTAIVHRRDGGRDIGITGIRADIRKAIDYDDYTNGVVLLASGAGAAVAHGSASLGILESHYNYFGNRIQVWRVVESADTAAGNENAVASSQLSRFQGVHRTITLDSDAYDIGGDIDVGDNIYVWDDELGLYDLATQVAYRGQTIYPVTMRVVGCTWPVHQGMGVYFIGSAPSSVLTDLTEWVEWEDGKTTIDVGAQVRTIDDGSWRRGISIGAITKARNPESLAPAAVTAPRGSFGYAEDTSLHSTKTDQYPASSFDIPGCTVDVTCGPNRRIKITGHALIVAAGSAGFVGLIREGSTELGRFGQNNALNDFELFEGSVILRSPSEGTHTYKLSGCRTAGAGSFSIAGNSHTSWIDVADDGPDF